MMKNANYEEIEVKLYTPDHGLVSKALDAAGAVMTRPRVFERNARYENAANSLTADGIVLRLRQDSEVTLTYKCGESSHDGIFRRFEAEVTVGDFATMDLILRRLGYHVALNYEKYRRTYALGDAEIVLDELPYGNFTEIEGDAETIERVIAQLGLGGRRRMNGSYLDIFAELKLMTGLETRDLRFEDFVGVDVAEYLD